MNAFVKDVENYQELHNPSTWSGDEPPNHGHAQHPTSPNELLVRPNDIFDAKFDTAVKIIISQANAAKKMLYRSRWLKSWQWDLMEAEAVREKEENPGAPQVRTIMGRLYDQHFAVKKSGAGKSRQLKLWKTLSSTINTALGDWLTPQIVDTLVNLYGVPIEILFRRLKAEHHEQRDGTVEEELFMAGAADQDTWGEYHPFLYRWATSLDAGRWCQFKHPRKSLDVAEPLSSTTSTGALIELGYRGHQDQGEPHTFGFLFRRTITLNIHKSRLETGNV